jgi:hypothetical protein
MQLPTRYRMPILALTALVLALLVVGGILLVGGIGVPAATPTPSASTRPSRRWSNRDVGEMP